MIPTHSGPIALKSLSQGHRGEGVDDLSTDAAVEQAVCSMLAESPLSKAAYIEVSARNGVVTLDGTVSDGLWLSRFKNQVTSAIPTVTIVDRLEWVVPDCSVGFA